MTTHLSAVGNRTTSFTIAAALMLVVLQTPCSADAHPTSSATTSPLRQGIGMTGTPSVHVLAAQRALRQRGYDLGRPGADGRFGPLTAAAVLRFQARSGAVVEGVIGARTGRALDARASTTQLGEGAGMGLRPSVRVRQLQRMLVRIGFDVGRPGADGRFGPLTAAAVRRMQRTHRLAADGIVGPQTRRVVRRLARGALDPPSTTAGPPTSRHPNAQHEPGVDPSAKSASAPPADDDRTTGAAGRTATRSDGDQIAGRRRQTSATTGLTRTTETADTGTWTLFGLFAAVCAATALAMRLFSGRRGKSDATLVPIRRDLCVEGYVFDADVGAFRGFAIAAELTRTGGPEDHVVVRYLVDDPQKPAPIWVRAEDVSRPVSGLRAGERVIGYVAEGDLAGEDGTSQTSAIHGVDELCAARGWALQVVIDDDPRANLLDRPGLRQALREISAGRARGLVMSDSASLADPLRDIAMLLERLREAEAALVVADLDLDTTTPAGRATASTLAVLGNRERDWRRPPAGVRRPAARTDEPGRSEP
jgi:peptidoglycan hydrolase-like protein with peptidoglycan-binding domain